MKKITKFLIHLSIFLMLVMPAISFAVDPSTSGLVPCNNNSGPVTDSDGTIIQPVKCDFNQIMALVNKVIKFILYDLAIPIAAIMFAYAGFLLVSSGGSTEQRGKAKSIFTNVLIGLIIAMAAFLIVRTILSILGYKGDWIGFNHL